MTSSTLGEPEARDVPRRCSAQSHGAALSHLQPNRAGTNPGGGPLLHPQAPASPTEPPPHSQAKQLPWVQGAVQIQVQAWDKWGHSQGDPSQASPQEPARLETLPERSTGPAHIPHSPSAPLLAHPRPRACHGLPVPAHGQRHVGLATGKAGHISAWASCLFFQALFAGAEAVT